MRIEIIPIPAFKDNYIWVISVDSSPIKFIVDPGESEPILQYLNNTQSKLGGIFITHHHWDHTGGVEDLIQYYNAPIYGPKTSSNLSCLTCRVTEGDAIELKPFPIFFKVLSISGHTLDHIAYYTNRILFCGDTLFAAGCGRLFEGTAEMLWQSLQKIKSLPKETLIYCAHEYTLKNLQFAIQLEPNNPMVIDRLEKTIQQRKAQLPTLPSTLELELKTNPFLRTHETSIQTICEQYANSLLKDEISVFKELRSLRDNF